MKLRTLFTFGSTLLLAAQAQAGVGKISSPDVEKGVAEVEYSGTRYSDNAQSLNNAQSHTVELEYGFTKNFMFGLEGLVKRESPKGSEISGYGVEAQYQLTHQGEWWLSSAVKAEYTHAAHDNDPEEAEVKLLAAYERGPGRLVGNLNLERQMGSSREHGLVLSTALQATHALDEHFKPGLEWHADHGPINDLGQQNRMTHYVGPVVTGTVFEMGDRELNYQAGYYWGLTDASAAQAARVQLSYEFKF